MESTIRARMENVKQQATKSQKLLIEFLESGRYHDIIYLSITEMAELTGVGEATILRFCRQLGFNGYQDFKLHMAQEIENGKQQETEDNYIRTISTNYIAALEQCRNMIDPESIEKAVELILRSRCVSAFGVGNSRTPALELHNRLLKMGVYSQCEQDAHLQNILMSSLGKRDCLILFSVSGGTKDVLEVAELAKQNGVAVVVVTSHDRSPLTRYADVVLLSVRTESPADAGAMVTKIVQLYLVDILCTGIFLSDEKNYAEHIDRSNRSVVDKLV